MWPLSITMAITGNLIPLPHITCRSPASLPHTTLCSVLLKPYASSVSCVPCDPAVTLEGAFVFIPQHREVRGQRLAQSAALEATKCRLYGERCWRGGGV